MTRTVQWLSVVLNRGKWLAMMALVLAYGRQKDAFLRELTQTIRWGDLDAPGRFATGIKRPGRTSGNFPPISTIVPSSMQRTP